jgi:hypothetical protein
MSSTIKSCMTCVWHCGRNVLHSALAAGLNTAATTARIDTTCAQLLLLDVQHSCIPYKRYCLHTSCPRFGLLDIDCASFSCLRIYVETVLGCMSPTIAWYVQHDKVMHDLPLLSELPTWAAFHPVSWHCGRNGLRSALQRTCVLLRQLPGSILHVRSCFPVRHAFVSPESKTDHL